MNELVKVAGVTALAAVGLFFAPLLGTLFGAFSGWVVGLFFADTILGLFQAVIGTRLPSVAMWQLGAFLGFLGGFFRVTKVVEATK